MLTMCDPALPYLVAAFPYLVRHSDILGRFTWGGPWHSGHIHIRHTLTFWMHSYWVHSDIVGSLWKIGCRNTTQTMRQHWHIDLGYSEILGTEITTQKMCVDSHCRHSDILGRSTLGALWHFGCICIGNTDILGTSTLDALWHFGYTLTFWGHSLGALWHSGQIHIWRTLTFWVHSYWVHFDIVGSLWKFGHRNNHPKNVPALAHSPWAHSKNLSAEITTQKMHQHYHIYLQHILKIWGQKWPPKECASIGTFALSTLWKIGRRINHPKMRQH